MKKLFIALISISILVSCGSSKKDKEETLKEGRERILAVLTERDSTRQIYWMLRVVQKVASYDSVKKKDYVKVDVLWGKPLTVPLIDSVTKKPILDSLGNPKADPITQYVLVNKDSVDTHVENIPMDSLLKRR